MNPKHADQPRDPKGRFLSYDGTRNQKFTLDQLKEAYLEGAKQANSQFHTPTGSMKMWLKAKGY